MSYNGSGTFQINTTGQPVVTGTVISSTAFNALTADLATGLSTAITKDGQTATTARIPFAAGISSTLTTDATSTASGSIITAGGVGIAKAVYVGTSAAIGTTLTVTGSSTFTGAIAVDSVTDSSSTLTGSIQTDGGLGVAKALFVGTTANVAGAVTLQNTLAVGGVATYSAQPIFSSLTASKPVFTDAFKGLVSTGTLGADQGGTGVANNAAMTVTGSGNFAYTRTLTGTTNVTFPTTGTLATLAGSETFTNKTLTSPAIGGTPTGVGILTSGTAVASTSGTSIDFTSIPSWVKRITVMFNTVSTNGTSNFQVQLGAGSVDVASYESSGEYAGTGATSSTGLIIRNSGAANAHQGHMVITQISTNLWIASGVIRPGITGGTGTGGLFSGYKSLSGTLDRIRITTVNGTDTFDSGSINILYE